MLSYEEKQQFSEAAKFRLSVRKDIGRLCFEERQRQNLYLETVSRKTGLTTRNLEALEMGRKRLNWKHLKILLDFYNLRLEITLPQKE